MSRTIHEETFIVFRDSREESTVAVVRAVVETRNLCAEVNFLEALKTAITLWISGTPEGKAAWESSSKDFNVGDLADVEIVTLAPYLKTVGILQLDVTPFVSFAAGPWSYGTVLVHEDQIECARQ